MRGTQGFVPASYVLSPVDAKRWEIQRVGTGGQQRWRLGPANVF